jgi:hypothetical protein
MAISHHSSAYDLGDTRPSCFFCMLAYTPAMVPRNQAAVIRSEIERLQKARNECNDTGVLKRIDSWIEEQKRKLVSKDSSKVPSSRR